MVYSVGEPVVYLGSHRRSLEEPERRLQTRWLAMAGSVTDCQLPWARVIGKENFTRMVKIMRRI